jgi:hypothetical protein
MLLRHVCWRLCVPSMLSMCELCCWDMFVSFTSMLSMCSYVQSYPIWCVCSFFVYDSNSCCTNYLKHTQVIRKLMSNFLWIFQHTWQPNTDYVGFWRNQAGLSVNWLVNRYYGWFIDRIKKWPNRILSLSRFSLKRSGLVFGPLPIFQSWVKFTKGFNLVIITTSLDYRAKQDYCVLIPQLGVTRVTWKAKQEVFNLMHCNKWKTAHQIVATS